MIPENALAAICSARTLARAEQIAASDRNILTKQVRYDGDEVTPVSYTHLDVYKRQGQEDKWWGPKAEDMLDFQLAPMGLTHEKFYHDVKYMACLVYTSRCV